LQQPSVLIAATLVVGIAAQWLAWRAKLPAIVFLLLAGVLAGPVTGLLQPDQLFVAGCCIRWSPWVSR
jgi:NhaP-type Na+/H+ or K+/H+ antiporter